MVYKTKQGWAYSHQCTDKHRHIEGPFDFDTTAELALEQHKVKCNG